MPNIGLAALPISTEYRTGDSDPVEDFYRPCLYQAVHYRRAVGFFRSSIYNLIGTPIIEFARRGGKIQMVCSPDLTEEDVHSIDGSFHSVRSYVQPIAGTLGVVLPVDWESDPRPGCRVPNLEQRSAAHLDLFLDDVTHGVPSNVHYLDQQS